MRSTLVKNRSLLSRLSGILPTISLRVSSVASARSNTAGRIPESLDGATRFSRTSNHIVRGKPIATLSADSRKFFTTTSAQIGEIQTEMNGHGGNTSQAHGRGTGRNQGRRLSAATQRTRTRPMFRLQQGCRRSLPAIRDSLQQMRELARQLEGAARIGGLWSETRYEKHPIIRVLYGQDTIFSSCWPALGDSACSCGVPHTMPSRMIEPQLLDPGLSEPPEQVTKSPNATSGPSARYTSTRTIRAPCVAPQEMVS